MKATIYTTPTCKFCPKLKAYLEENAIEFDEINVAENQEARELMIELTGQMGVPVTVFPEPYGVLVGFNEKAYDKVLFDEDYPTIQSTDPSEETVCDSCQ